MPSLPLNKKPDPLSTLPGPKGLPILGNLLQIDMQKLHLILEGWSEQYGEIYRFKMANKTVVAISNPSWIQTILKDRPDTYRRGSAIEKVGAEFESNGVFAAEGAEWQRQRHVTMQAFKTENLRRFYPELYKICERLKKRWQVFADTGQTIDIRKEWMRFTVDVTTQFAFGYDINLLEQEDDSFQRHLEKFLPVFNRRANAPFPYWHFIKLPSERAMEASLAVIKETINGFVQQTRYRLAQQAEATVQPANFLEALLLARDEAGEGLSNLEIQGNIITMLLAGEDTTAHTLSWLLYLITEHPAVQHKMQQEADAVMGADRLPQDMGVIEQFNYIEAVAQETLRLKSVTPLLFMEPIKDVEIAGISIPKGTSLMLINRFGALQEENFTGAHNFRPERWLEATPAACNHNRNASAPFGAGPRFCPGRNLALLEIKMAMAMVCKNFSVNRVETEQPVQEIFSFTMMPDNLMVKLAAR
ncbi:MAG: cytochrome P450 [Methylococcaceae bacterium]|nr:cytochrome P450 [Methylococcaceae bacterium]